MCGKFAAMTNADEMLNLANWPAESGKICYEKLWFLAIVRVHTVHVMNTEQHRVASNPWQASQVLPRVCPKKLLLSTFSTFSIASK